MKKSELVYKELLYQSLEQHTPRLTQLGIATKLHLSLNTVNTALAPLRSMGAVRINSRSLDIVSVRKILLYWASVRRLDKDILYQTRVEAPVADIEKQMPADVLFTAYSAYRFRFGSAPADYSEVYVYAAVPEMERRFPPAKGPPNLFVLRPVPGEVTAAQLFVDLWNLKEWYAKAFLDEWEKKYGLLA